MENFSSTPTTELAYRTSWRTRDEAREHPGLSRQEIRTGPRLRTVAGRSSQQDHPFGLIVRDEGAKTRQAFPQVTPGPILVEPRPRVGPAKNDLAQV